MAGYYGGDKWLEALELGADVWAKADMAGKLEKMGYAADLHRFGVFSLPQIAKIVRLNPKFIYAEFRPNSAKGGRFDPQTLSTLVRIRRAHLEGRKVPDRLIQVGIEGGTSFTCITALAKIPYSKYYDVARAAAAEEKKVTKPVYVSVAPETKENVFSLREQGLTQLEIANATGLDQPMVSRILRGLR